MKDQILHNKDGSVIVCTEGRLVVEFTFDDLMRIRSWHFATRQYQELIPRSIVALQDPGLLEQMSKNITRQGLTTSTLNYLRLCVILEPMQELMSRHKAYSLTPRDCLKTTLFQKWQRMVAPPETQRPASKRRKRKSSATNSGPVSGSGGGGKKKNANANSMSPGPPNFSLASQDVMVVGEPSLMGGEFGDEDERLITRLENNQYDPTSAGPSNGIGEEGDGDFVSLGGPPVSSAMTSGGPWNVGPASSGAGGPLPPLTQQPQCTPGSGPPSADNRPGSTPNGSSVPVEDKKPSPNSLNQ
jgi:LIM domain-binding protein 1